MCKFLTLFNLITDTMVINLKRQEQFIVKMTEL